MLCARSQQNRHNHVVNIALPMLQRNSTAVILAAEGAVIVRLIGFGLILHGVVKAPSPQDIGFVIAGLTTIMFGMKTRFFPSRDD